MDRLSEEEKKAIEYLKARLYGNTGCKFIDVAQKDLRIFLYIVENQKKGLKQANTIIAEQDKEIIKKNNKICDLEFKIEKQQVEINKEKEKNKNLQDKCIELEEENIKIKHLMRNPCDIPRQIIIEKMNKDINTNEHTILVGRRYGKTLEYGIRLGRIQMCKELLEEGDDK